MRQQLSVLLAILAANEDLSFGGDLDVTFSKDSISIRCNDWEGLAPEHRRAIKRVFGPLKVAGSDSWKYLQGSHHHCYNTEAGEVSTEIELRIYNSVVCEITSQHEVEEQLDDFDKRITAERLAKLATEVTAGKRKRTVYEYDCKVLGAKEDDE